MIVQEDYAKKYLAQYGILTPGGTIADTVDKAMAVARKLDWNVVVKAVVPTGGRGKAGGVRICREQSEVKSYLQELLGSKILGHTVHNVLVEEVVDFETELYAAVHVDTVSGSTNILFSEKGGVDVESRADEIKLIPVEPGADIPVHRVLTVLNRWGIGAVDPGRLSFFLATLFRISADIDATLLEVNPLAVLRDGKLAALDCKCEVDNNSLARHKDFMEMQQKTFTERELRASEFGVSYVPLEGMIGVITSGAGLGMASIDMLNERGLPPANFLDTGGGISEDMLCRALKLILEPSDVKGCLINLYGGINRMKEAAKGIAKALEETGDKRIIVAKILGNQQEEAWDILSAIPNVHVIKVFQTETAVEKLEELLRQQWKTY
jgi:succinyl-CoA synthetase beta subunit